MKILTILIGLVFALVPALIAGILLGIIFNDYRIGLIFSIGIFCFSLDVLFNGKS